MCINMLYIMRLVALQTDSVGGGVYVRIYTKINKVKGRVCFQSDKSYIVDSNKTGTSGE